MNHNKYRIAYIPFPSPVHWKVEKRFLWFFWYEIALFETVQKAAEQLLIFSEMD